MTTMLLEWVATSIFLILVVLALRAALGRRMSARVRYALWVVVLVRLLVPVQLFTSPVAGTVFVFSETRVEQDVADWPSAPAAPTAPVGGAPAMGTENVPTLSVGQVPTPPGVPAAPDAPQSPDWSKVPVWLGWAWLAGAAAMALTLLGSNLWFYWRLRGRRIPLEGTGCPLPVYAAVGLPSPCLFGLIRPAVYVTPEAANDPDMLRHVLAHEYTHFRHGDHVWSLLRCAALAVHWWDPLVWLAARLSQRDGELACDEGALGRLGERERAGYGRTLLALVTAKPGPGDLFRCATTMAGDKKSLKERISRIAGAPKRVVWAVVVAVLVTALACLCAFGQKAEEPEDGPEPSPSLGIGVDDPAALPEVELGPDVDAAAVPRYALDAARDYAAQRFQQDAPEGVMIPGHGEYNEETGLWDWVEDPDQAAHFDRVRLENIDGPWLETRRGVELETWRINFEYHTTTPEEAENVIVGGMYLTGDGWLCPTYSNCTYLFFQVEGEERRFLIPAMINSCSPEDDRDQFYQTVEERLALTDDEPLPPSPGEVLLTREADLNRDGVRETLTVYSLEGEGGYVGGQRLEVRQDGELLWSEEGWYAHAGYNALFLCTLDDGDCLLRYNPYMGQGWCTYSYRLFTLSEDGAETAVQENGVEFDINFHPLQHQSFDADEITRFMDEINGLLSRSVQLMNTDEDLLGTFEEEGRLYDSLWWLGAWEPSFDRDRSKSLEEELRAFQTAMEKEWYAVVPEVFPVDELGTDILLRYQDKTVRFECPGWDYSWQPAEAVDIQVTDLDHDGRDELVFALLGGHGTGAMEEHLFAFDAETLEQYDTSGVNEMVLASIQSTGDADWFYLQGPGMPGPVTLNKHAPRDDPDAPVAEAIELGNVIRYTVSDGAVYCWLGCDTSGVLLNYEGYMKVWLDFTAEGGFQCGYSDYRGEVEP